MNFFDTAQRRLKYKEWQDYLWEIEEDEVDLIEHAQVYQLYDFLVRNELYDDLLAGYTSSGGVKKNASDQVEKTYDLSGNDLGIIQPTLARRPILDLGFIFPGGSSVTLYNQSTAPYLDNFTQSPFSIFLWLKPFSMGQNGAGHIANLRVNGGGDGVLFNCRETNCLRATIVSVGGVRSQWSTVDNSLTIGEWQFIYLTWNFPTERALRMYSGPNNELDYQQTLSHQSAIANTTNIFMNIGNNHALNRGLHGDIGDYLFFKTIPTNEQITDLYNLTKWKYEEE